MNLYHYTDLNAVHSILDTNIIRMTDIRFLNDKTEYLQGLQILEEASHEIFPQDPMYDPEFLNVLEGWLEKAFKELFEYESASEVFYVTSFSRSSDILSQWRSYGMFAIEFDEVKLAERVSNFILERINSTNRSVNMEFIECHYVSDVPNAIEEASELICSKVITTMDAWWQKGAPLEKNLHLYTDLKEIISMLATTFKHSSFSEEQEVRLVVSNEITSEKINFRTKNNILVPFYELDVTKEVISGVIIGPVENQKITEHSLDLYNLHRAAKLGGERYRLTIETSDIPYRML